MATYSGSAGLVYVGMNQVAEVKSWSLEVTSETVDASVIGTPWRKYHSTIKGWSGSIEAFWDKSDSDGQGALTIGSTITLNLYPEGKTAGSTHFTGNAIIASKSVTGSFDGIVEASFTFSGSGALTESKITPPPEQSSQGG